MDHRCQYQYGIFQTCVHQAKNANDIVGRLYHRHLIDDVDALGWVAVLYLPAKDSPRAVEDTLFAGAEIGYGIIFVNEGQVERHGAENANQFIHPMRISRLASEFCRL